MGGMIYREILNRQLTGKTKLIDGVEHVERLTEEYEESPMGGRCLNTIWEWVPKGKENLRGERG